MTTDAWDGQAREVLALHRSTGRSTDAGLSECESQGAGGGATSEKRTPPPLSLVEGATGAGFPGAVSEAATAPSATWTGGCCSASPAGAPQAAAPSTSGSGAGMGPEACLPAVEAGPCPAGVAPSAGHLPPQ